MHDRGVQPALIDDTGYTNDDAGNLTSIKRTPGQGMPDGQAGPDTQCFVCDQLRRMTSAWTAADDTCTGGPSKATVGGDQPYWHSYTFDDSGNRTALTEHDPAGNTAKDIKRTYSYGGEAGGPNRLAEVASEGPGGTTRSVYGYDKAGNTTTRQHNGTTQTLKWDPEGALTEVSEPVEGGTTKYLNDASGERLLRHGPDGSTTVRCSDGGLRAIPAAASPGGGQFFGSHVEVQAATIMRILAKQSGSGGLTGRLMVSKPGGPCSFCAPNVAGMLPGNSSLVVRFQRGRVFGEVTF
ncbi:hypothetical protein [Streptomyces albidoflavus]|uniref:hypothetical protein n=1 Tax=Streptomyces albidoflavus TaxID=1886 RepID=UPI0033A27D82